MRQIGPALLSMLLALGLALPAAGADCAESLYARGIAAGQKGKLARAEALSSRR